MTPEQKRLLIRSLELREQINGAEDVSPQLEGELIAIDQQLRRALAAPDPVPDDDGEATERSGIRDRVAIRHYLAAAASDGQLSGAESEYNAALNIGAGVGVSLPLALLSERADVPTPGPAITAVNPSPIAPRLFPSSVAAWLGVEMPSVPAGTRSYVYLSAGHTPAFVAESAAHDSTAGAFTTRELTPSRITGRYTFSVEDLAMLSGMESALTGDLRTALSDALDTEILTGDGTGQHLSGLMDLSGGRLTNPGDPTAAVTWATGISGVAGAVDGIHAAGMGDLLLLSGVDTFVKLAATFQTNGERSLYDYLRGQLGGVRVSSRVPAAVSDDARVLVRRGSRPMSAVAPIWDAVSLIRDPYTGAASGTVAITASMLTAFDVVYPDAFQIQAYQLA